MLKNVSKILKNNLDAIGVFVMMSIIFGVIMFYVKWATDLPAHALFAQQMLEEHRLFDSNFLMYFLANLFSFFTGKKYFVRAALTLVVKEMAREYASDIWAKMISLSMLFIYIIPWMATITGEMYYGYYVPNVWHNSTIICSMPFAIAIYWLSVKQLDTFDRRRNGMIAMLTALCVLVKPSFYFVYAVAYPIVLMSKYGLKYNFWRGMLPVAVGLICMGYEYLSIYGKASDGSYVYLDFETIFTIEFWKTTMPYILCSLALPVIYSLAHAKRLVYDREWWLGVLMLIAALGIFFICKEGGPRATHGNFGWQVVPAMWIMYYYVVKQIVIEMREGKNISGMFPHKNYVWLMLLCLHTIVGVIFVTRLLINCTYA